MPGLVIGSLAVAQFVLLGPTSGSLVCFHSLWIKEFVSGHARVALSTAVFLFAQAAVTQ